MTDTTRDLIQRMAKELDLYRQMARDDCTSTHPFADEARAFLAQPEPEDKVLARVEFAKRDFNGPSDVVLAQYCDNWFYGDLERTEVDPVDLCRGAIRLFAQTPAPIPVSERPWERDGWCDGDGWCWVWNAGNCQWWEWINSALISFAQDDYTHSLPHYALPIPPATEKP